ncbi:hypothetical protein K432DRAFT_428968 [Lepidopterella palustris CBS 459.81]|uniref:Uncharacterized protein n=1 Tax=Lepidopterella palustris CBS 459.81 TaxID=1314670 RepID=A0A8E2JBM5_9PEZI|nr:hypothetical protein K432DRAFT_428968 [Lepidopterella palustris CBS 459.81]
MLLIALLPYQLLLASSLWRHSAKSDKYAGRVFTASDRSTILDQKATAKNEAAFPSLNYLNPYHLPHPPSGLPLRYKASGFASQFARNTPIPGTLAAPNSAGPLELNVLLHGDGGQSFSKLHNQAVRANIKGVAILAPDSKLFRAGSQGPDRTDGVAHAQAVDDFVLNNLPKTVAFDQPQSSLLRSPRGFLEPQVKLPDQDAVVASTTIHFQSTRGDLSELQTSIPTAIVAYENLAI